MLCDYECFKHQSYSPRELLVFDSGRQPSPLFTTGAASRDRRVRYIHSYSDVLLGEKRMRLVEMANGEVLANFDDDDIYTKHYLEVRSQLK